MWGSSAGKQRNWCDCIEIRKASWEISFGQLRFATFRCSICAWEQRHSVDRLHTSR